MTMTDNTLADRQTRTRNLVVCLDGTSNEPETGFTNVARMFEAAAHVEATIGCTIRFCATVCA